MIIVGSEHPMSYTIPYNTSIITKQESYVMWKIRKFSLDLGRALMTTRLIDEVHTTWTIEAGLK